MHGALLEPKLAAARTLARSMVAGDHDVDSVYIAGSLTAGLGNATSDADLFVLDRREGPVDRPIVQHVVDGHRIDVEHLESAAVARTVAEVTSFTVRRDNVARLHGMNRPLDTVARLAASETVVDSPLLAGLKARIGSSARQLRQLSVNYFAINLISHQEDFLGAMSDGDFDTMAIVGQDLVANAGKAVAAAAGDIYVSKKWMYKQLSRLDLGDFPVDTLRAFQHGSWIAGGLPAAEALLRFAQTCVGAAVVLSGTDAPIAAWSAWTSPRPATAVPGCWRHPAYSALRLGDGGVLLHWELQRQVVLKEAAAVVWALCVGQPADDLAAQVAQLSDQVGSLRALTSERIRGILDALEQRGLVGREPTPVLGTIGGASL